MPAQWTGQLIGEIHNAGFTIKRVAAEAGLNDKYVMGVADWSRTCEGCRHVVEVPWPVKGSYHETVTAYRCFAPGSHQGYHIGTERLLPYIPAWCPERKKTAPDGANIRGGRPKGQQSSTPSV